MVAPAAAQRCAPIVMDGNPAREGANQIGGAIKFASGS